MGPFREIERGDPKWPWPPWLWRYGLVFLVYLLATGLTRAHSMGDTLDYGYGAASFRSSDWEFGHLLWVPLGWLLSRLFHPLSSGLLGFDDQTSTLLVLMGVNRLAGLASVLLFRGLVVRVCQRAWIADFTTLGFLFSQAFLNYAHSGCSYIPGLTFLLLGLTVSLCEGEKVAAPFRDGLLAGTAFAAAVCLWFLYIWAIPAALAAPLFLIPRGKSRTRLVMASSVAFILVTGLAYVGALAALGIHSPEGVKAWIASSSHGITGVNGISRAAFGLPRSFINMGQDGVIFKRFLLKDPFNPVPLAVLFRLSLWKLALFYLVLAAVLLNLLGSSQGRRLLCLFLTAGVPVLGFAVFWQGGDMERYLPLYPFLFLALAYSLAATGPVPGLQWLGAAFLVAVTVVNGNALARWEVDRQEATLAARVESLEPVLKPQSGVVVVKDELQRLTYDFPLDPTGRHLPLVSAVTPGLATTPHWRQGLAARMFSVWREGGDVWVSKRLLSPQPRPEWAWVEGDDRRVSWMDIYTLFSSLEMGRSNGGEDGFLLVPPSPKNQATLMPFAQGAIFVVNAEHR